MARYGMVIDLRRCIGCYACVMACKAEHTTPAGVSWNRVIVEEKGEYPRARMTFTPVLCNHCSNPPCEDVCPSGATYKSPDGIVAFDSDRCIGCQYCVVACPYQARNFNQQPAGYFPQLGLTPLEQQGYRKHTSGTVSKCIFCKDRVEQGKAPACVVACPAKARTFGDLNDPKSEVAKFLGQQRTHRFLEHLGTEPKVYYIPDQERG